MYSKLQGVSHTLPTLFWGESVKYQFRVDFDNDKKISPTILSVDGAERTNSPLSSSVSCGVPTKPMTYKIKTFLGDLGDFLRFPDNQI